MAASGKTVNYDFGIYNPNDTCSYLQTFNQNMTDIDRVCKETETVANEAKTVAGGDHEAIDALQQSVISLQNTLTNVNNTLTNVQKLFKFTHYQNMIGSAVVGGTQVNLLLTTNGKNMMSTTIIVEAIGAGSTFNINVKKNGSSSNIFVVGQLAANVYNLANQSDAILERDVNSRPTNINSASYGFFTIMLSESFGELPKTSNHSFNVLAVKFFAIWDGTYTWILMDSIIAGDTTTGYTKKVFWGSRTSLSTGNIISM